MRDQVEWVRDPARFAALRGQWNELAAGQPLPFLDHSWFTQWWDAFGAGRQLAVCALWRGDHLVGAFPLMRSRSSLQGMANDHSPVFEPVARDADALERLVGAVVASAGPTLRVACLPASGAAVTALHTAASSQRRWELERAMHTSPIVRTAGSLTEYLSRSGLVGPLRRYRRKMEREFDARFQLVEEPQAVGEALDRGFALEAAGWKGKAGSAIVSSPGTERFYRGIAASLLAQGDLRVSSIWLDDRLVAWDLYVLRARRLWLIKTAYDESFRKLSPGMVLRLLVIERCFELGLEAHELAGSSAPWKLRFANDERRHVLLESYGRGLRTALRVGWYQHGRPFLVRARRTASARRRTRRA